MLAKNVRKTAQGGIADTVVIADMSLDRVDSGGMIHQSSLESNS